MPGLVSKKSIFNIIIYKPSHQKWLQRCRQTANLLHLVEIRLKQLLVEEIFHQEVENQFCQNIDPAALVLPTFYVTPDSSILQGLQGLKVKKINNLCIKWILPLTSNQNRENYFQSEAGITGAIYCINAGISNDYLLFRFQIKYLHHYK